jgi:perosamine synthetase
MIARKRLDIGWTDLAYAAAACAGVAGVAGATRAKRPLLTRRPDSIVCLSVRSGLDLLLGELAWPPGTEVLLGAITIPDIPRILQAHGLVPVPVDVDPDTLELDEAMLERARTERTRALLVTHLFGSRLSTDRYVQWAHSRGLLLWEDCAQAFTGDEFAGNPQSDVRMFSFGPIKTGTALGGGVLLVGDGTLLERMRARHARWPAQRTTAYAKRLAKMSFFKPLLEPHVYSALIAIFHIARYDHDEAITRLGRSFVGGDFFARLRQRPCPPLVQLLERRLATYDARRVTRRAAAGERLRDSLLTLRPLARAALARTHWLFPVRMAEPAQRKRELWAAGFDATCGATSLYAVPAPAGREPAVRAEAAMREVLYVPIDPDMGTAAVDLLASCLDRRQPRRRFSRARARERLAAILAARE